MLVSSPDEEALEDDFAIGEALLISDDGNGKVRRREPVCVGETRSECNDIGCFAKGSIGITLCQSSLDFQRHADADKRIRVARYASDPRGIA